jgi:tol-pal system protein YbgF
VRPAVGPRSILVSALAAALAAAGCVSTSDIEAIQGQLNEIQRQILQVQQHSPSKEEVAGLEETVSARMELLLRSEADMQVRLQELSSQIEQLQAKLEDTNYRLNQLSQTLANTNQELQALRAAPPPTADGSPPAVLLTTDPEALYQTAYNDYLRGSYDLAIQEFQEYLNHFPETELADNAVYWIGESYYRQRKFRQAIEQFDELLNRYPRSDKVPSAALKKGYAHLELGERSQGVVQLQYVLRQFPGSDEANLAAQRLREIER